MKRLALLSLLALAACDMHVPSPRQMDDPQYLVNVAPDRLLGTWHEIAAYPNPYQVGCDAGVARISRAAEGALSLLHRCRAEGQVRQFSGRIVPEGKGSFSLTFDGAQIPGEYRILGTSRDGRTILVGTPSRFAGWVLHRDRSMTEAERRWAASVFRKNGYDEAALQLTRTR